MVQSEKKKFPDVAQSHVHKEVSLHAVKKGSKDSLHALFQVPEGGSGAVSVIQIVHRSSGLLATFGPGWRSSGGGPLAILIVQ